MTEPVIAARLDARALQDRLASPGELAVLDVREAGRAFDRHLLFSSAAPVGRLGLLIDRLVPRRTTPIVLVDERGAPDGEAELAAAALARFGYGDVRVLAGGVDAWAAAGHEIFSGTNVPSKAFGEIVEHALDTPNIDAATLAALQAQGADLVVLDSRPFDEFRRMSIPGALDCPGVELLYRALDAAPSPDTLIVVNCAGRTRSIIGAQSLINAGVPNPVAALTGGSMAWLLEGLTLEHGAIRHAPRPSDAALAAARALAATLAERAQVPSIDAAQLQRFEAEQGTRTLYRFDVRDPAEYAAGHAPGWRHAAGGQLVQATDDYVGTRGARIVLTDTDGVRARLTASWLRQLGGYEVYVIDRAPDALVEIGPEPLRVLRGPEPIDWIEPSALQARLDAAGTVVIDVDDSLAFRRAHVRGARFVAASDVPAYVQGLPADTAVVLTSRDGVLASLVAQRTRAVDAGAPARELGVLLGGTARWLALGLPSADGDAGNLSGQADRRHGAYDVPAADAPAAMRGYLQWELDLVAQIERVGGAGFAVRDFGTDTARRSHETLARIAAARHPEPKESR